MLKNMFLPYTSASFARKLSPLLPTFRMTSCGAVALNYLESNTKIPWDDLRYIFGEIM